MSWAYFGVAALEALPTVGLGKKIIINNMHYICARQIRPQFGINPSFLFKKTAFQIVTLPT